MDTEDRWYVRFRGHTLGPLTTEQVKSSVRRKELGPEDKLASTANPTWRALRTQEEFLRCWEAISRPVPAELAPLPSPKILWQKKRAPLPPAPASQPAKAAPTPSSAPASSVAPAASTSPANSQPKAKPAKKAKRARPNASLKAKRAPKKTALAITKSSPSLAPIPEKPEIVTAPAIPAELSPAAPTLAPVSNSAPGLAAAPKLAEETLSLLEALRDWNRQEKETANARPIPAPPLTTAAPPPEFTAPLAFSRPEFIEPASAPAPKRAIELRLNLVISKQFIFIFSLVLLLAVTAMIYTLTEAKKMRGPEDSRLPDPSSPTINPSTENDPIPQLKAPTRPRRD